MTYQYISKEGNHGKRISPRRCFRNGEIQIQTEIGDIVDLHTLRQHEIATMEFYNSKLDKKYRKRKKTAKVTVTMKTKSPYLEKNCCLMSVSQNDKDINNFT